MNDINPFDGNALYKAEVELRNQIDVVVDFLRKYIPGYENCMLAVRLRDTLRWRSLMIFHMVHCFHWE